MRQNFIVHTPEEIDRIRVAASLTASVRDALPDLIRPGMTTLDVDEIAGQLIRDTGGKSAFLGYCGFPANICVSVNEEVIHGIGSPFRTITEDDIVSVDVGVEFDGAIGDCALTFAFKELSPDRKRLLNGTREALRAGIAAAKAGNFIRNVSSAVENVAKRHRLGIVREYTGHGCGIKMHEPPEVPNYVTGNSGPRLVPGMVICIEPMLNLGRDAIRVNRQDGWTVSTADGADSAHFEEMVLITDKGTEVLTSAKK